MGQVKSGVRSGRSRSRARSEIEAQFGAQVRRAREALGLTQAQLAHELTHHGQALDPTMVAKIEAATRPTNVAEVIALSRVLRVAPSVLLEGQDLTDAEARWIVVEAEASKLMQRREQLGLEIGNVDAKLSRLAAQKAQLQTQVREERERGQ